MRRCKLFGKRLFLLFLLAVVYPTIAFAASLPDGSAATGVAIQAKGSDQASPGQATRFELCGITNNSTDALEDFYIHDRLPTDAVRIKSLVTGKFSGKMYYQISYRTNLRGYKVFAANLQTTNSYEFSLHPNVLGLSAGEYIKDIRFEFPKVYPGFKSTGSILLTCEVMPAVPKDYNIVNRADLGGRCVNDLLSASASSNTKAGCLDIRTIK